MAKDIPCNGSEKRKCQVSNTSIRLYRLKIIRHKEAHYRMIKGTIQQENIKSVKIYTVKIGAQYKANINRHKVKRNSK